MQDLCCGSLRLCRPVHLFKGIMTAWLRCWQKLHCDSLPQGLKQATKDCSRALQPSHLQAAYSLQQGSTSHAAWIHCTVHLFCRAWLSAEAAANVWVTYE